MRIAVTSQDFQTVSGHAGRARRFLIYELAADGAPTECARLDLDEDQTIHATQGVGAHPIDGVNVILSAGFGAHFAQVMAQRGIQAVATDKQDPAEAVRDFLVRRAAGMPSPEGNCGCGGGCHGEGEHHHEATH